MKGGFPQNSVRAPHGGGIGVQLRKVVLERPKKSRGSEGYEREFLRPRKKAKKEKKRTGTKNNGEPRARTNQNPFRTHVREPGRGGGFRVENILRGIPKRKK